MSGQSYNHVIDVENEEYTLYFGTDDEELFKKMQYFIGGNMREWWLI